MFLFKWVFTANSCGVATFLNYGEKHGFGEFIVWVAEEFIEDS